MNAIILNPELFDVAHYAGTTEALRKCEVASDNKRTDWARETGLGLVSGAMTEGDLTAALLAAFKPKKPNGKAGDSLSSLRYAKGGDAVRKAAETVLALVEASEKGTIAETFRPVLIAFVTDADGAPKSLAALKAIAAEQRKAVAKAAAPASEEGEEGEEGEGDAPATATPLATVLMRAIVALNEADAATLASVADVAQSLMDALEAASERVASGDEALAA